MLNVKFGLCLIAAFCIKAILSVILQTGFSFMLIAVNSIFLFVGLGLVLWGLKK